jgi:uncharacterized membrane protein YidH (DUF202 family)
MEPIEKPAELPKKVKQPKTPEEILKKEKKKEKKKERKNDLSELAYERIKGGFERLQIAWMKAAITFIALGFTAYKFYIGRVEHGDHPIMKYANGRHMGMFLIFVGLIGLIQATIPHIKNQARIKKYYPGKPYSVALVQSYFIMLLSLVLLLVLIFRA